MSIADTISSMETNLSNAYDSVNAKGGTLPANKNLQNLSNSISSIPSGGAELPEINSVRKGTLWYAQDETEGFDTSNPIVAITQNTNEQNIVQIFDGQLVCYQGLDKYRYKNGQWEQALTSVPDYEIYGYKRYYIKGNLYQPYYDTANQTYGTFVAVGDGAGGFAGWGNVTFTNTPEDGRNVWHKGDKIYYSDGLTQWEYDYQAEDWVTKSWTNVSDFDGKYVWTDGNEYYYSDGTVHYVLENNEWVAKTWNYNVNGLDIWTDGVDTYYSNDTIQKKLVDGQWTDVTFTYIYQTVNHTANFYGRAMIQWGNAIYGQVSFDEIDDTDPNDPQTITTNLWLRNNNGLDLKTSVRTNKVGDNTNNENSVVFTLGNVDSALQTLNNGNIGGGGVLITKTITENGVYNAIDDGASGYSSVDVQVSGGGGGGNENALLAGEVTAYTGTGTSLRDSAFIDYQGLTSVNMPNCTDVGTSAFSNCGDLSIVSMPLFSNGGDAIFRGCYNLTSVNFPSLTSIPTECFAECGLTSYDFTNVEVVGDGAFSGCYNLSTFTNLGNVREIQTNAFVSNPNFTGTLSLANTEVVSGFAGTLIDALDLPSAIEIGENAFADTQLSGTISLPNVTSIGGSAFARCSGITAFSLPLVETVGMEAFLETSITSLSLPACTSIEGSICRENYGLTSVSLPLCTYIGEGSFVNCSSLTSVTMPSVEEIHFGAFSGTGLSGSMTLSNCTHVLGEAFSNCDFTTVILPSILFMGNNAFGNNTNLTTVALGSAGEQIENLEFGVFNGCTSLDVVQFKSSTPPQYMEDCFDGSGIADFSMGSTSSIQIPAGSLSAYTQAFNDFGLSAYITKLVQV